MAKLRYEPNPKGLDEQLMNHIHDKLQEQFTGKARDVIRRVKAEMAGQPADEVLAALMSGIRAAGMEPNEAKMRECAESISAGTCT
jgi:hypothetical protein